jgi:hypothetical protein
MIFTRFLIPAALVLSACTTPVPNSAPTGAAVTSLEAERARREAALQGQPGIIFIDPATEAQEIEIVPQGEDGGEIGVTDIAAGSQPAPVDLNNPGISDEQDFDAVAERESIESDAERIARQREAYTVIQPTALPERSGAGGPNIVEYALSTTNALGESIYRRTPFNAERRFARACGRYASADQAQEAFLANGGPERDRRGMDPDGDGFACFWDPTPFRTVRALNASGR